MGTRCEHIAIFYMPHGTPWNPLVPVAIAYSCFNYQHRRSTDTQFSMLEFMLCDKSLRRPGEEYNTWRICVGILGRCLLFLRRTTSKRTWRNVTRQVPLSQQDWKIYPNVTCQILAIEFLRTNRGRIPIYRVGPGDQFRMVCIPSRKHMTERPIYELSRGHRLDNRLSFHRWRNSSRRLEAFPAPGLRDRASFCERGKPRECEVDGRCQL
jgi:hypothetical protein